MPQCDRPHVRFFSSCKWRYAYRPIEGFAFVATFVWQDFMQHYSPLAEETATTQS